MNVFSLEINDMDDVISYDPTKLLRGVCGWGKASFYTCFGFFCKKPGLFSHMNYLLKNLQFGL